MPSKNWPPKGWREMKSVGEIVEGTNFVPCKAPINISKCAEWTLSRLKQRRPDVKFIIDMAGTEYYSPRECEAAGTTHRKIVMKPDRGNVPAEIHVQEFFKAVEEAEDVLEEGELIAVHCTRGLNRTGYMICR